MVGEVCGMEWVQVVCEVAGVWGVGCRVWGGGNGVHQRGWVKRPSVT
jgi:hypothetical protein